MQYLTNCVRPLIDDKRISISVREISQLLYFFFLEKSHSPKPGIHISRWWAQSGLISVGYAQIPFPISWSLTMFWNYKLIIFFLNMLLAICKISKSERLVLKAERGSPHILISVRRQLYRNIGVPVLIHATGFWVPSPEVSNRSNQLTQCCTQFKSPRVKILCVLYLHCNVAFTFKWYGNSRNETFYSQRVSVGTTLS